MPTFRGWMTLFPSAPAWHLLRHPLQPIPNAPNWGLGVSLQEADLLGRAYGLMRAILWGFAALLAAVLDAEASPTTIHRRIKSLRKKGVIQLTVDEIDNRIKYVAPTALATEYFAQLSNALVKATKG